MSSRIAGAVLIILGIFSCFLLNEGTFMIIAIFFGGAAIAPTERERGRIREVLHKKKTANYRATRYSYYIKTRVAHEKSSQYRAN